MTISTTTNRVTYTGNGVTVAFSFPYAFFAKADLVVVETIIATGVQTTKALTTHYTISGSVDALGHYSSGGTVTALTAPASTVTWTIYRDPAATQTTDLVENDPMPAESLEAALDYQTMLNQRTRDIAARCLQQPEGDSATIGRLPSKVDRADTVLAFDSDGDPIPAVLTSPLGAALPITGGTLTGALIVPDKLTIRGDASDVTHVPKLILDNTHATEERGLIQFADNGTTRWAVGTDFDAANGTNSLTFHDAEASLNRVQIEADGTVKIYKILSLLEGALKFPAVQNASADANTLDDYEEGTWTPSVGGNATYHNQNGSYVKIGKIVVARGRVSINVLGTGSTTQLSGLPFTSAATFAMPGSAYFFALATNVVTVVPLVDPSATTITLYSLAAAGTGLAANAILGNSATVQFTVIYETA